MGRKGRDKVLEFIDTTVALGQRVLASELKLDDQRAREVATLIVHQIVFTYGKTYMYVPEAIDIELTKRDEEIWVKYNRDGPVAGDRPYAKKFSRDRVEELAAEYGLCTVQIYNILRLQYQRQVADRQGTLAGFEEPDSSRP